MNVINIEEEAFFKLIEVVVVRLRERLGTPAHDKWVSGEEAMRIMRITSKTTLQKLRDTGAIRYTQPAPKIILYDRDSIDAYLEKHAKETF